MLDPASTYIDDTVTIGPDTVVYPNVLIEGATTIGASCVIGSGSQITASRLADGVRLQPLLRPRARPWWRRAPSSGRSATCAPRRTSAPARKVGNFVELKKTRLGRGTQGQPPRLHRRRHRGRGREHRRRHDHVQLRRLRQARDHASATAPSSAPTSSLVAPHHHRRGGLRRRRLGRHQGRAAGRARRRAQPADRRRTAGPPRKRAAKRGAEEGSTRSCAESSATSGTRTRSGSSSTDSSGSSTAATTRPASPC